MAHSSTEIDSDAAQQAATDMLVQRVNEQIDLLAFDESDQDTLRQLVESFADKRGLMRLRIAETLGQIGEPATPVLVAALAHHPNEVVRRACAKTLTLIADPAAIPTLVNSFLNDTDTVVQGSSVGALARTGRSAAPELLKILDDPKHPETTKGHAAWALAFMGSEAKDLLLQALNSESEAVRAAVVGAIAKVAQEEGSPDNYDILINALGDNAESVRCEAAAVLGNLAYQPAIPTLLPLLAHPNIETRKSAILAIMKIGQADTVKALETAKANETDDSLQPIFKLAISQIQKKTAANDDWD
ncbi:HEAT repeat domain-containing protein [Leptolyngbya cf. ectocarpi LEGE 11479]|uniref:HEAT repeat domain-containing protein n=1 Tax=Leptolyngbya cf. ectocarpi LEGE 11479 TaxID=1828722 RepID=A0A928X4D7_LEPEC|nr:HEAT repeat domain-containing protein [Leptolyngbya ectocarpi]MBE9066353.1 HEAT repeat domain-containing protein [Leptolyngbya cf. ectocarpi LEGE 11479]